LTTLNDNITIHEIKTRQIYLLFFLWEIEFAKGAASCTFSYEFPEINQLSLVWWMVLFAL